MADVKSAGITIYARGNRLIYTDTAGVRTYYHQNGRGDVILLTDGIGTIVKSYEYDAFGREWDAVATDNNPFRYCGEYYDKRTETVYLRARYYDSAYGRFTQEDPIRDGTNWYIYCDGDPVNRIDPTGCAWWHWIAAVAVVAVAAVAVVATAGGVVAGAAAVAAVASGTTAASGVGATIAAGAFLFSSSALMGSAITAASSSTTVDEFADKGEGALINTAVGAVTGATYGATLEVVDYACNRTQNVNQTSINSANNNTSEKKPYANSRPSYGKNQVEQVWDNAKDPETGKVYDPSGVEITWDRTRSRNGQWDMGHVPGQKYSDIHDLYMDGVISKEEFLKWYREPLNYRPELPATNRSHMYE